MINPKFNLYGVNRLLKPPTPAPPPQAGEGKMSRNGVNRARSARLTPFLDLLPPAQWDGGIGKFAYSP